MRSLLDFSLNIAQEIIKQVMASMNKALANQVELSKSQLLQMMSTHLSQVFDEYLNTVRKKLDEINRDMDNL